MLNDAFKAYQNLKIVLYRAVKLSKWRFSFPSRNWNRSWESKEALAYQLFIFSW